MGRFDAALASIVSSWRSRPGSPGLSRYASWPGGPSKISVNMLDKARWKTASVVVIDSPLSKTSTGWFVSQVAVIDESMYKRELGVGWGPATGYGPTRPHAGAPGILEAVNASSAAVAVTKSQNRCRRPGQVQRLFGPPAHRIRPQGPLDKRPGLGPDFPRRGT